MNTFKQCYDVSVVDPRREYIKINLNWDYENNKVHLPMNPFCKRALKQFNNVKPSAPIQFVSTHTTKLWGQT